MIISIYKTKKLHIVSAIVVAFVLMFSFTIANGAYNDVTLTTDAVISVNSLSLTVSGSSAVIESIAVDSTDFDVTLQSGSTFKVVSTDKATFTTSATAVVLTSSTCTASESTITLSGGNQVTVTITPSATECDDGIAEAGGSGGGGGGGGGGGSVTTTSSQTTTPTPTVTTTTTTAEDTTEETTTTVTTDTTTIGGSSLTQGQIDSIIGLLSAFGAEQSVIDNVLLSLSGGGSSTATATQTSGITGVSAVFTRGFARGASHPDIKRLQQLLNSDPDTAIATSGIGSSGNETNYFGSLTEKAVQKFQMKHGVVSSSSDSGYGYLGPKTRAKLNQIFGQ